MKTLFLTFDNFSHSFFKMYRIKKNIAYMKDKNCPQLFFVVLYQNAADTFIGCSG